MAQSATGPIRFAARAELPLDASVDLGQLTSDGGVPWLAEGDDELGLCAGLAAGVRDWRREPVGHDVLTLVRQRVFQLAWGYEDQDDADTLRTDPLLKAVCGRRPATGRDLASPRRRKLLRAPHGCASVGNGPPARMRPACPRTSGSPPNRGS